LDQKKKGERRVKTAVICSARAKDPNPAMISDIEKITHYGDVLRLIGGRGHKDLSEYDRIFVLYQYPVSPVNQDFIDFCNEYKDDIKSARLIISFPVFDMVERYSTDINIGDLNKFIDGFWPSYAGHDENKVLVIQRKYQKGCRKLRIEARVRI
jgi:hypothetical protein